LACWSQKSRLTKAQGPTLVNVKIGLIGRARQHSQPPGRDGSEQETHETSVATMLWRRWRLLPFAGSETKINGNGFTHHASSGTSPNCNTSSGEESSLMAKGMMFVVDSCCSLLAVPFFFVFWEGRLATVLHGKLCRHSLTGSKIRVTLFSLSNIEPSQKIQLATIWHATTRSQLSKIWYAKKRTSLFSVSNYEHLHFLLTNNAFDTLKSVAQILTYEIMISNLLLRV
jgi:hypothetical protein